MPLSYTMVGKLCRINESARSVVLQLSGVQLYHSLNAQREPLGAGGGGGIGMLSSSFVVGGHIHQGNELGVGVGGRLDHEVQGEMPVVYPVCNV